MNRLVAALIVFVLVGTVALAGPPALVGVRAGFDGQYKVGSWTPVVVTLRGSDEPLAGQIELTVPDGDGVPSRVMTPRDRVALPPGQDSSYMMFVKFGQRVESLQCGLRVHGDLVGEWRFEQGSGTLQAALSAGQELIVGVGPPISIDERTGKTPDGESRTVIARLDDVGQLPTQWYGYEGVDLLILTTSEPETYRNLSGARLEALDEWVRLGGRILLCVGRMADEILAPDAPLARFAPGKFERSVTLRQSGALETYADTTDRLDRQANVKEGDFRLEVPKLTDVRGQIEVFEGQNRRDLPLVIRSAHGLGEVVFVGLDLDQPPLSTWNGRKPLIEKLLARAKVAIKEADSEEAIGEVRSLGYTDLVGQLHTALDQFAQVQLVPFWAVAALVIVYILLIGPADYFFLKKVVGRMEFTWITFPLVILAFSLFAYLLAYRLKGTEARMNQVDLVDVDVESGEVRGTTWNTIYSPQIDSFDFALEPHPEALEMSTKPEVVISWMDVPGTGLSGMRGSSGATLFSRPYDFSPQLNEIRDMPIAIWSTRSLLSRWSANAGSIVKADLADRGDRSLDGTIEMPASLQLSDAVIIYERWAYPIPKWPVDGTVRVDKQLAPQTVETYYRRDGAIGETLPRYEASSVKLSYVLNTMMFHDLIGGHAYTSLTHESQSYVDLSSQVRIGRAVLVGSGPSPASTLLRDGESLDAQRNQQLTVYRFVLPVKASGKE